MGFFENIGADTVSWELAKIVRTLSSDHKIESDLDLYVTALNNLCSIDGWTIHSGDKINVPFIVESIKRNPIRVAQSIQCRLIRMNTRESPRITCSIG